jgi:hypothetical protein
VSHLSNGPKKLANSIVQVNLINKTIKCDAIALDQIIYIQACWKRKIAMRHFKVKLVKLREKRAAEFRVQLAKLRYLYPPYNPIVYSYALKRLKKLNRHDVAVFRPYMRRIRGLKHKYTYFFRNKALSERQLEMKYLGQSMNKLASNVSILMDCAVKNDFDRMMNSRFILTAK